MGGITGILHRVHAGGNRETAHALQRVIGGDRQEKRAAFSGAQLNEIAVAPEIGEIQKL